jgi:AmmeMemoRadiSam system protein A
MITYAALSPHPPLIIPDIGGENIEDVHETVQGMQTMARELLYSSPDTIIFLTPHGNVFSDAIAGLSEPVLEGDFLQFGSKRKITVENDTSLLTEIEELSVQVGITFISLNEKIARVNRLNPKLDHGILVPLYYLQKAGMDADIQVIAISISYLSLLELYTFGSLIRKAADNQGKRIAVLASGDMSHRLKDEGPYGYHPDGPVFDELVKKYLESKDVISILNIPEQVRENAGECGYRSLVIMLGALDGYQFESQVFTYQGPFGVGYLTAGLVPGGKRPGYINKLRQEKDNLIKIIRSKESLPVKWARIVLENYVQTGVIPETAVAVPDLEDCKNHKAGVFVSLKKNHQLRGCIGTIMPANDNVVEEIAHNAISAGTKDPRFPPVKSDELEDLVYSVDIIGIPEPCKKDELDPKKYGVIVSQGNKKGVLLPDLEGVDTVEEQLTIALQKAGIAYNEKYNIQRFDVKRFN